MSVILIFALFVLGKGKKGQTGDYTSTAKPYATCEHHQTSQYMLHQKDSKNTDDPDWNKMRFLDTWESRWILFIYYAYKP